MKRIFRLVASLLVVSIMVTLLATSVFASSDNPVTTSLIYSESGYAGQWESESVHTISSTQDRVYGGDAGIWMYVASVGLSASYYRCNDRYATYQCIEQDVFDSVHFRTYKSLFEMVNGLYRPHTTSLEFVSAEMIEGSSGLELYMKYFIDEHSKDTSDYVPAGLFTYKFWTY